MAYSSPQEVTSSRFRDRLETVVSIEEEDITPSPMGELEQEVALAQEQIRLLQDKLKAVKLKPTGKSLLKPRDISILELKHLKGLEAEGRLNVFLTQVEAASDTFEDRQLIVMARVDQELAMYLQTTLNKKKFETWEKFKDFLMSEFSDTNLDKAYTHISQIKYDWADDPQTFATEVKCKYSVMEAKFPKGSLPNMEKVIKRKLLLGLPSHCKERLEIFTEESISLKRFIERVETERLIVMSKEADPIRKVEGRLPQSEPKVKNAEEEPLQEINKQLAKLEQNLNNLRSRTRANYNNYGRQYCPYCKMNNHTVRNCRRNPPPGSCYDCLKTGCYRGKAGCPGIKNVR